MNKTKILAAALIAAMALSGCTNSDAPQTGSTFANGVTTTEAKSIDQEDAENKKDTFEKTEEDTSDIEYPKDSEKTNDRETESNSNEAEESVSNSSTSIVAPFGETVLEEDIAVNLMAAIDSFKFLTEGDTYYMKASAIMEKDGSSMTMDMEVAHDPSQGIYSNSTIFGMTVQTIKRPDGSYIILNATDKTYVITTEEESGMSMSVGEVSAESFPAKENVTTADKVLIDGEELYRFYISADNSTNNAEAWIYTDIATNTVRRMYATENGMQEKLMLTTSATIPAGLFDIPSDYTEISYEEYQAKLYEGIEFATDDTYDEDADANGDGIISEDETASGQ